MQTTDSSPNVEADQNAIRVGIAQALEPLANPTNEDVEQLTATISQEQLDYMEQTCGLSVAELLAHTLRGFSYAVGDVRVEGDHAWATVELRSLDLSAAKDAAIRRVEGEDESNSLRELYLTKGDDVPFQIIRHVFGLLYEELDASTTYRTSVVVLELTCSHDTWTLVADSEATLVNAITAGV